jgi:hypothetical protein
MVRRNSPPKHPASSLIRLGQLYKTRSISKRFSKSIIDINYSIAECKMHTLTVRYKQLAIITI